MIPTMMTKGGSARRLSVAFLLKPKKRPAEMPNASHVTMKAKRIKPSKALGGAKDGVAALILMPTDN
jgi:hypothetical protein